MFASGQKPTLQGDRRMSDIYRGDDHVRFGPIVLKKSAVALGEIR
jgi:hypothetical protein